MKKRVTCGADGARLTFAVIALRLQIQILIVFRGRYYSVDVL